MDITSEPSLQDIQKLGGVQETVSSENSYNSPLLDQRERSQTGGGKSTTKSLGDPLPGPCSV